MTDATKKDTKKEPAMFNIVGQFAKDVSLECPLPPFAKDAEKLSMQMDVGIGTRPLEKNSDHHEVVLKLRSEAKNEAGKTCYLVEVEYAGVFAVKNIAEKDIAPLLSIDGASLIFPFARQLIMQLINDAGYQAPMITPVNFHAMFMQNKEKEEKKAS